MATASNPTWTTLTATQALTRYAPEAEAALNDLIAATAKVDGSAALANAIRETCAQTLSLPPLRNDATPAGTALDTDTQRIVHAFVEQFCLDVSALDDSVRAPFVARFGDAAQNIAYAIYIADLAPRLRRALEQLFAAPNIVWPQTQTTAAVENAFFEFVRVVYNLRELDPVTTELVRMRGARQHNCRLCKSLRAHSALAAGIEETQIDAVDHYRDSDLSAAHKAALALTDAIIWQPAHIGDQVIADIRTYFTPQQAIELVLDVTRNAANKSIVSLGTDESPYQDVQIYNIDSDGKMHVGLEMPTA